MEIYNKNTKKKLKEKEQTKTRNKLKKPNYQANKE